MSFAGLRYGLTYGMLKGIKGWAFVASVLVTAGFLGQRLALILFVWLAAWALNAWLARVGLIAVAERVVLRRMGRRLASPGCGDVLPTGC